MKVGTARWLVFVLVLLVSSQAVAGDSRSGSVRGDVYTAPDKSFQFDLPKLIEPDTFVRDVRESPGAFKIVMGDDLCRRFFVIRHELDRFADFESYWQARLKTMQVSDVESSDLDLAQGRAVYVSGTMPHVPVCVAMTFGPDGELAPDENGGSEIGLMFIASDDAWYEFGYVIGQERAFAEMYGVGNIRDELDQVISGFRVLGPRQEGKLPEITSLIRFVDAIDESQCEALGQVKGKSTSFAGTVDAHMHKAQAKLREEAQRLGANAIVIRNSKMKSSVLTGYPYMILVGDALACDEVPEYMAWEIGAS
ncbi:MAG: DUF4156 domain-containing protein [Woeseiaceae bacterium]|jgi:uncharacterized protein YbjQ (UPF0145 family)